MKNIERHSLIDRIGRELQSRMTYPEIKSYLATFGVNVAKETSGINSKWVYSKELLADTPVEAVLRIADELEIAHGYTVTPAREIAESRFWAPNHFRLFVSHLSSFKGISARLQSSLRRFGISAFIAHVDIESTKEWQDEIEAALYSMDALTAILMPGFKESDWTDQETGIAIGRGVLVIPIMRGLTPYGFIEKYQGLNAHGKSVAQVANELFRILIMSAKTRNRAISCLVETTLKADSEDEAKDRLAVLDAVPELPASFLEGLREGASRSQFFVDSTELRTKLNDLLRRHGLAPISAPSDAAGEKLLDDDVPF